MGVDYGEPFYFMYPLAQIIIVIALYFLLRNRSRRLIYWVLFALFAFNFALHFLKLLFYPYTGFTENERIRTITPENICAFNVMLFPFLYLSKKPALRDYMFYVGIISGFSASWLPSMGDFDTTQAIAFDTVRFYTCHGILWTVPLLMVMLGEHKLNYRRIWQTPLMYFVALMVVLVNNYAMQRMGYWKSNSISNNGYTVGPPDEIVNSGIGKFVLALVPSWFKPSGDNGNYWPVAWQIFPVFIIGCPLAFLIGLPFEYKRFYSDIIYIFSCIRLGVKILRFGRRKCRYRLKYGAPLRVRFKAKLSALIKRKR